MLVGHSMGGIVVTQAAAKARSHVERLIYVTAFLPRDGESLQSLATSEEADDAVQRNMVVEPPVARISDEGAAEAFYSRCSQEQIAWALPLGQPQPLAPLGEPVRLDGGIDEIDRYYIRCTEDRAISIALQRQMSTDSPCREVVEIVADHSPFLSAGAELVDALDRFARA